MLGVGRYCEMHASLVAQKLKRLPATWETRVRSLGLKIPWRRKWQPTPEFLPKESHGRRSLVGYSSRGRKESDTTERFHSLLHSDTVKCMLSRSVMSNSLQSLGLQSTSSSSMEFSRQEYRNGLPFPSPKDLPDPGIKPGSPVLQANSILATREL